MDGDSIFPMIMYMNKNSISFVNQNGCPWEIVIYTVFVLHSCWGPFFRSTWHNFIENPCHINILLIFWVNLFKVQNKLIFHSTTWIGLTWPVRSLLQEADSWPTFPFHQLGSYSWYHQHQHMDQAKAMNQSSRPILPLLHSWQAASSTRVHIYTKWQQNPR